MGGCAGGGGFGGTKGSGLYHQYSGNLLKVNNPDVNADKLAQRIKGESSVKFENDPNGKEFDTVSDKYIAETKPALKTLNTRVRKQMKAAFEAAKATGRSVYYHFDGQPDKSVTDKLYEYSTRYDVKLIIDTVPFRK
ncbi:MAG: hypothetical protein FWC55_08240 [Firmicutes bacterium]|nr:hypothetical protein [Bacillota bacterium]